MKSFRNAEELLEIREVREELVEISTNIDLHIEDIIRERLYFAEDEDDRVVNSTEEAVAILEEYLEACYAEVDICDLDAVDLSIMGGIKRFIGFLNNI